ERPPDDPPPPPRVSHPPARGPPPPPAPPAPGLLPPPLLRSRRALQRADREVPGLAVAPGQERPVHGALRADGADRLLPGPRDSGAGAHGDPPRRPLVEPCLRAG